jgi:hypothetical protein
MRCGAVLALLAGIAALRALAISRAPFNWDELALFDSVARTLRDGVLRSGGRPGLAQILVMPLVEGCRDEARVAQIARGIWLVVTSAYLAGVFALLMELLRDRKHRVHDACLGVALLALVPAFLEWSLQVRTDHLALCGAAWGGVALLRSERRPGLALFAGLCFGLGWISSQKLAYAAALGGLLAASRLLASRSFEAQREAWRAGLAVSGFGTVLLVFRAVVMWLFTLPESHAARQLLGPQLEAAHGRVFPFYRMTIGYSQYADMLPTLVPHALLLAGLVAVTAIGWRGRRAGWLATAWAVLALGAAVGIYHAAAFAYFWMTLGLFPAVAGAIAAGEIRERLLAARPRWLAAAAVALWAALLVPAALESALLLRDRQAVQRDSLAFLHRNFAPEQTGFHPEGGPFCATPHGLGIYFSQRIFREFAGDERARHAAAVERYFRTKPVHYIVQSFRLNQFPPELRQFFADHYQPYRGAVFVAGSHLSAGAESFELLIGGRYRWLPRTGPHPVEVDGAAIAPGGVVTLAAGAHAARLPAGAAGMLVLAVEDPPGKAPISFYGG